MASAKHSCEGTTLPLRLVVGVMSRPSNVGQRMAVRVTWGRALPDVILPCFLVGKQVKRTPRSPWDKRRAAEAAEPDGGPKGELSPNPAAASLAAEHATHGDVLVLDGSAEIHSGGTSGLKTLTWWRHVAATMPNVVWVGKCDDDTLINVPRLLTRLPPTESAPPRALFGTIKWGCYSDARNKWEPSWRTWPCGRTQFARSQAPGEAANLSLTYEGPYELALGWFFAMPRRLAALLAHCRYAAWFHERALHATHEPFLRKEDDPLNGFWLYKCLKEAGEGAVQPLKCVRSSRRHAARAWLPRRCARVCTAQAHAKRVWKRVRIARRRAVTPLCARARAHALAAHTRVCAALRRLCSSARCMRARRTIWRASRRTACTAAPPTRPSRCTFSRR
jgi:hypothetical protein